MFGKNIRDSAYAKKIKTELRFRLIKIKKKIAQLFDVSMFSISPYVM